MALDLQARSQITKCTFTKISSFFYIIDAANSTIDHCQFSDCKVSTELRDPFSKVSFFMLRLENCKLSHSDFINCQLTGIRTSDIAFSLCETSHSIIENCRFSDCSFKTNVFCVFANCMIVYIKNQSRLQNSMFSSCDTKPKGFYSDADIDFICTLEDSIQENNEFQNCICDELIYVVP